MPFCWLPPQLPPLVVSLDGYTKPGCLLCDSSGHARSVQSVMSDLHVVCSFTGECVVDQDGIECAGCVAVVGATNAAAEDMKRSGVDEKCFCRAQEGAVVQCQCDDSCVRSKCSALHIAGLNLDPAHPETVLRLIESALLNPQEDWARPIKSVRLYLTRSIEFPRCKRPCEHTAPLPCSRCLIDRLSVDEFFLLQALLGAATFSVCCEDSCPVELKMLVEESILRAHGTRESLGACLGCGKGAFKLCSGCGVARYCSIECQKKDWKEGHHKSMCSTLKEAREECEHPTVTMRRRLGLEKVDTLARWLQWLVFHGLHRVVPWQRECGCFANVAYGCLPRLESLPGLSKALRRGLSRTQPLQALPASWEQLYDVFGLIETAPDAVVLSHAMSFLHGCIGFVSPEQDYLCVHWIGAEKEADSVPLLAIAASLFFRHFQSVRRLHMLIQGPMVGCSAWSGNVFENGGKCCSVEVRGGRYHCAKQCNIVFAPNAGFGAYPSWKESLTELAANASIPLVCTDISRPAAKLSIECAETMGFTLLKLEPNVWASPRPEVSESAGYGNIFTASNAFLFVLQPCR